LCAEEGEYANVWPAADDVRDGGECVLDNEGGDLLSVGWAREEGQNELTLEWFRLARSTATAPPSDWPKRITGIFDSDGSESM